MTDSWLYTRTKAPFKGAITNLARHKGIIMVSRLNRANHCDVVHIMPNRRLLFAGRYTDFSFRETFVRGLTTA